MENTTTTRAALSDRAFVCTREDQRKWSMRRPLIASTLVPVQGSTLPVYGPDAPAVGINHNSITFMDVRPFRDLRSPRRSGT